MSIVLFPAELPDNVPVGNCDLCVGGWGCGGGGQVTVTLRIEIK